MKPPTLAEETLRTRQCVVVTEPMRKLRCFMAYRLAVDYHLLPRMPDRDKPSPEEYSHFSEIATNFTKMLGNQFSDDEEIKGMERSMLSDVFVPGWALGLTSDVLEYFFFTVRCITKGLAENESVFNRRRIEYNTRLALAPRIAIDFGMVIDKVILHRAFNTEVKQQCLLFHERQFGGDVWLEPRFMDFRDAREEVAPSFLGRATLPGDWPNVAKVLMQARRPSEDLVYPAESHGFVVEPRLGEGPRWTAIKREVEPYRYMLPSRIWCAGYPFLNPDGPEAMRQDEMAAKQQQSRRLQPENQKEQANTLHESRRTDEIVPWLLDLLKSPLEAIGLVGRQSGDHVVSDGRLA